MSRNKHHEFSMFVFVLRFVLQVVLLSIVLTILAIYKFYKFLIGAPPHFYQPLQRPQPKSIISYIDAPAVFTALTLAAVGYMLYIGYFDEDIRGLSLRIVNSITHPGKY